MFSIINLSHELEFNVNVGDKLIVNVPGFPTMFGAIVGAAKGPPIVTAAVGVV